MLSASVPQRLKNVVKTLSGRAMIKSSRAKHLLPVWYQQLARGAAVAGLCLWPFPTQRTYPLVPVRIFRPAGVVFFFFFSSHIKCTLRNLFQRDNSWTIAFVPMLIILWRPCKLGKMSFSPQREFSEMHFTKELIGRESQTWSQAGTTVTLRYMSSVMCS